MGPDDSIETLLEGVRRGDKTAADRLFSLLYDDLRNVAHRQLLALRPGQTLNTTGLVHETYLKLFDRARVAPGDRQHFFATAARAMRQIIVDQARAALTAKRGGRAVRVPCHGSVEPIDGTGDSEGRVVGKSSGGTDTDRAGTVQPDREAERLAEVLDVDRVLIRLRALNERMVRVVEMRFFAGFGNEEVAELLNLSPRTVKRDWQAARAFLYRELGPARG